MVTDRTVFTTSEPAGSRLPLHRFYRADPARQRATGGAGLGLAIVKHLVEAQGGRVWAARRDGVTFGFSLPDGGAAVDSTPR